MQSSWLRITFATFLLIGCSLPSQGQAAASAFGKKDVLDLGAGASAFRMDWGSANEHLEGVTAWGDFNIFNGPLARISPEIEFRDLPGSVGPNTSHLADWSLQGGLKVRLLTRSRFRLFGVGLAGPGHFSFPPGTARSRPTLSGHSEVIYSVGAGVDMRLSPKWSARAEYQMQWWPNLVYRNTALTPSGVTVGALYSFDHWFHK